MVSVVMTTYNHEKLIIQAVKGVLFQKCDFEFELIIANDKSPDNTDSIIKDYLRSTNIPSNVNVHYTEHSQNKGMMLNIIWAVKQIRGKYIAVCEGDDYWIDPFKLQKQVDFLEQNHEFGLVHTNYKNFFAKTNKFEIHKSSPSAQRTNENDYYLQTGDIRTCTVLFRASFLPKFKDLLNQNFMNDAVIGDRPFFLLISKFSKIHFINEITSVYYITSYTSASHFSDLFRYYDFLKKVSTANIAMIKYLQIDDFEYIKEQQRKIYFYEILLSLRDRKYFCFAKRLFSKTGRCFWNSKELREIYGLIKKF